ncbi:hypothetical protein SH601_15905 [Gracilibacillus sp. S3-1-1]|uniref:Uncharacterized protein n=1 Tax=Gracilibacillus pellucidus TaxID=3095368 RepID=A0ACC6M9B6_9BACI|nr:hypothetical protein [Gracilibacillus sp. S3-1-1]MDX8047452.1 hypothetical protein [Gracilibacillus sp. S3-1-1]
MNKTEKVFGVIMFVIIIASYVIPFTMVSGITKWYGSFFIWVVLAILTIVVNNLWTRNWGEEE